MQLQMRPCCGDATLSNYFGHLLIYPTHFRKLVTSIGWVGYWCFTVSADGKQRRHGDLLESCERQRKAKVHRTAKLRCQRYAGDSLYCTVQVSISCHQFNCLRNTVTLMLENHFSQRVVNVWNSLPPKIVDSSSLRSFKRTVKTWGQAAGYQPRPQAGG